MLPPAKRKAFCRVQPQWLRPPITCEDEDEDDDGRSEKDATRENDDYEKAFRGSREMRDAMRIAGIGPGAPGAQYAPYIDKFKCWAKRTRRVIKNATVIKTMTLWLTTQLLGDEELDFSKPPRMKKGARGCVCVCVCVRTCVRSPKDMLFSCCDVFLASLPSY